MKSIHLIHAKTKEASEKLLEIGAIEFAPNVFLSEHDCLETMRRGVGVIGQDDVSVLDIFCPNSVHSFPSDHLEIGSIKQLFSDLHGVAFRWSKYDTAYRDKEGLAPDEADSEIPH